MGNGQPLRGKTSIVFGTKFNERDFLLRGGGEFWHVSQEGVNWREDAQKSREMAGFSDFFGCEAR